MQNKTQDLNSAVVSENAFDNKTNTVPSVTLDSITTIVHKREESLLGSALSVSVIPEQ